jgi:hypothetical protein
MANNEIKNVSDLRAAYPGLVKQIETMTIENAINKAKDMAIIIAQKFIDELKG